MDIRLEEVQKVMDEQLLSLGKPDHEPRAQRDAYTHISKLPNELLLEIFMVMKAKTRSFSDWHKRVNLVCRHWRAVAIGAPILWSKLHTSKHNLTVLMLERSNPVVLNIYIDFETASRTTAAILKYVERIRLLRVDQGRSALEETQDVLLGLAREPSRLQFLIISCISANHRRPPEFRLSSNIVLKLNQLQYLRLSNVVFDWNSLSLHNLKYLGLENTALVAPIPYQQLIDCLHQMPQLEVLLLPLSTILPPHRPPSHVKQPAHMPRLYYLILHYACPDHLHSFLSHTELPILRCAHINCVDTTNYTVDDYLTTTQTVFNLLRSAGFEKHFRSMEIHDERLNVSFCEPAPGLRYSNPAPSFNIRLPKFWHDNDDDGDLDYDNLRDDDLRFMSNISLGIMISMTRNNLFSRLTHAEISRIPDAQKVLRVLGKFPRLKSIAIHDGLVAPLTTALTIGPDLLPNHSLPFPKLDSITWRMVSYRDDTDVSELEQFRECLMMRHEYGLSVHEMLLFHCFVNQREVNLLAQIVAQVTYEKLTVIIGD